MSDEDAISLSDAESEGEGPNIRPPQAGGGAHGGKKHHKHGRHREREGWRQREGGQRHREEGEGKRDRDRRKSGSRGTREARRRDRDRERGGGRRGDARTDTGDLRHRLNRDRYNRDGQGEDRHRARDMDRYGGQEDRVGREEGQQGGSSLNKFLRANKHMEESRRDVEARKKRKVIEKEMEKLRAAVNMKRKVEGRSRSGSRSRDRHKRRKSESGEESQEEESEEEEIVSGEESEEADTDEGSESDAAGSDATTGSQKSEETPDRDESEEGELEEEEVGEIDTKPRESKSRSRTPVEGRWAEKSPSTERTPSRSPTPMRGEEEDMDQDGGDSPTRGGHRSGSQSPHAKAVSRSESPAAPQPAPPPSPPAAVPVQLAPSLPPYLPSVHGCRSVAEFKCLNRIEEGTYGVVYRARDKRTQEIVALKRLKMEREKEGFPITSLREINTLLISQHPNVVTVREIVVGSNMDQIYIVMDFVQHDLKSLMETMRKKSQVFLPGEVKCLMVQLLRAIHHLHDNWILHRDLKSSNLLLSHNGILKVGDFGLAREYGSPLKPYTAIVVTLWYRAPELLLGIKQYSTHIDVWSIGCILGELLLMEPLFPGKSEVDELNKMFKLLGTPSEKIWPGYRDLPGVTKMKFVDYPISHLREKFPERMLSESGLSLLKGLLTYDPKRRTSCEAALKADYFRENPLPIDPSMFPTWPAKSEQEPGDKLKQAASPKPPSGGHAFKNIQGDDDEDRAIRSRGFNLLDGVKNQPPTAGWNLKF